MIFCSVARAARNSLESVLAAWPSMFSSRVSPTLLGWAAGVTDLDWIVLTHIRLGHAGAAGHLAQRFPRARVVVREEGAPHLVDPARLWASAARLYPDMEGLWGTMLPVPPERIDAVSSD